MIFDLDFGDSSRRDLDWDFFPRLRGEDKKGFG